MDLLQRMSNVDKEVARRIQITAKIEQKTILHRQLYNRKPFQASKVTSCGCNTAQNQNAVDILLLSMLEQRCSVSNRIFRPLNRIIKCIRPCCFVIYLLNLIYVLGWNLYIIQRDTLLYFAAKSSRNNHNIMGQWNNQVRAERIKLDYLQGSFQNKSRCK